MKDRCDQFVSTVILTTVLLAAGSAAQEKIPSPQSHTVAVSISRRVVGVRAYPRADVGNGGNVEYLGSYFSDGRFRRVSKLGHMVDVMITQSVPYEPVTPGLSLAPEFTADLPSTGSNAPIDVRSVRVKQRFIQDFAPPARMVEVVRGRNVFGQVYDAVAMVVGGKENVMNAPHAVATDSRGRIIVTDPQNHAVHVFDYDEKNCFHILGGEGRRIQVPVGVAVDAQDNIYVTDGRRGMVLVYDRDGRFLRYIGMVHGENYYQRPTGIAVDSRSGRIYVLDTALHSLFILDMEGTVLMRIGKRGGGQGRGEFKNPTAVAVHDGEVCVVDQMGGRLQILDRDGHFRSEFNLIGVDGKRAVVAPALSIDKENRIYVGTFGSVRVYSHTGELVTAFGRSGTRLGEFAGISGIAVDSQGRMLIVDSDNARIQVFQLISRR